MPNRPRPACPKCQMAMAPVFRKRIRGATYARAKDVFWCDDCRTLARGRNARARFLR